MKITNKGFSALLVPNTIYGHKHETIWSIYETTYWNNGTIYYRLVENNSGDYYNNSHCESHINFENGEFTSKVIKEIELE